MGKEKNSRTTVRNKERSSGEIDEFEDMDDMDEIPRPKRNSTPQREMTKQQFDIAKQLTKLDALDEIKIQLQNQHASLQNLSKTITYIENDMTQLKKENERLEKELKILRRVALWQESSMPN